MGSQFRVHHGREGLVTGVWGPNHTESTVGKQEVSDPDVQISLGQPWNGCAHMQNGSSYLS